MVSSTELVTHFGEHSLSVRYPACAYGQNEEPPHICESARYHHRVLVIVWAIQEAREHIFSREHIPHHVVVCKEVLFYLAHEFSGYYRS